MQTFTVIYRTGGTENFKWNRVGERYTNRTSAKESADGLERMGYPALIHDTKLLDAIGLPSTYSANDTTYEFETFSLLHRLEN
jgi:hypothetical protein